MSDSKLQSIESIVLATLVAGFALLYVIHRLQRSRPDLHVGLQVASAFAVRLLAVAGLGATGLDSTLRGGDETTFLDAANGLAGSSWSPANWWPHGRNQLHTVIFAFQIHLWTPPMRASPSITAAEKAQPPSEPTRVVRVIARLNIGGPAIQAITLTRLLEPRGYVTRLVRGSESRDEGNMDELAQTLGVEPTRLPSMRRDPGIADLAALAALIRIMRRDRPQIVHTHAAKGGTLGRLAVVLAFRRRRRPILVHTFHGHSLSGYFSSRATRIYRAIERSLARRTDVLVAVSEEVRDDLVELGVAPASKFKVIPLGLDLDRFLDDSERQRRRGSVRRAWGLAEGDEVVTLVARLVPIKRVDRFLRVAGLLADRPRARFVVVGDGELREQLRESPEAQALGARLVWAGFRRDMADVCVASDVVVLTSDNEGTPVSLIEAQAAGVPVVGTDVGGVRSVVRDRETGLLAAPEDLTGLAEATAAILDDPALAENLTSAAREHVAAAFSVSRLVDDLDSLYRALLADAARD